ncbi:D-inositol-3-phosphate glycosyltransferase [Symmachiella macrocystis]|uniref:D-inositol-3-phosphate glycosyltransferase n=1 Tax=Symmachiella macrocystis TaxID=2527985 RepID=A0A5C6BR67_9PLAN|nr:glycosyltransferase family 1 protein [Symmachiella macrocystis]TWU13409.1 D-inositol-3-phosphate glycosyltransferase [Symmachiella macrocystis]
MQIPPTQEVDTEAVTPSSAAGVGRRIFVDCTKTYFFGGGTGIQRVVTELARHASTAGQEINVSCSPVVWMGWGFLEIGEHSVDRNPRARVLGESLRRTVLALVKFIKRHSGSSTKPQVENDPRPKRSGRGAGIVSALARCLFVVLSLIALPKSWLQFRFVRFQRDDVLLLPDANWSNMIPWVALENIKKHGAGLVSVMHDILPVRVPDTFEPSLVSRFTNWLNWACRNLDAMVCVSEATQADLNTYFKEQQLRHTPRLGAFRLGCNPNQRNASPRPHIVKQLESIAATPCCLCVGTLEPRKNHQLLLDACEQLWESGHEFGLVIVGKIGWRCDEIMHRMAKHSQLGNNLHLFHDLNDSELDLAYGSATVVIMPSMAEGLGLPIVEALRRKKPVIASHIPPHREAGGDGCFYFDPQDSADLSRHIVSVLNGGRPQGFNQSKQRDLPDWRSSTCELLCTVDQLLPLSHVGQATGRHRAHRLVSKSSLSQTKRSRATRDKIRN